MSDAENINPIEEALACLKTACGELEHTLEVLNSKLPEEEYSAYKKGVGRVIIAIYSGLADPLLDKYPSMKEEYYKERNE